MSADSSHIDAAISALLKLRDACTAARAGVSLLVRVDVPLDVKPAREPEPAFNS